MSKKQLVNAGFTKWSEVYLAHEAGTELYWSDGVKVEYLGNGEVSYVPTPTHVFIMKEVPWWEGLEAYTKVLVKGIYTGRVRLVEYVGEARVYCEDVHYFADSFEPATAEDIAPLIIG